MNPLLTGIRYISAALLWNYVPGCNGPALAAQAIERQFPVTYHQPENVLAAQVVVTSVGVVLSMALLFIAWAWVTARVIESFTALYWAAYRSFLEKRFPEAALGMHLAAVQDDRLACDCLRRTLRLQEQDSVREAERVREDAFAAYQERDREYFDAI